MLSKVAFVTWNFVLSKRNVVNSILTSRSRARPLSFITDYNVRLKNVSKRINSTDSFLHNLMFLDNWSWRSGSSGQSCPEFCLPSWPCPGFAAAAAICRGIDEGVKMTLLQSLPTTEPHQMSNIMKHDITWHSFEKWWLNSSERYNADFQLD